MSNKSFDATVPIFKNHFNAGAFKRDDERNIQPSLAVPDQSLSIQEIIKRHTRGIPIFGKDMGYDDQPDPLNGRHINSLDLEEVFQIADNARKRYKQAQEKYLAEQKLKQQETIKNAAIEEFKKLQTKANQGTTVLGSSQQQPNQGTNE